MTRSTVPAYRLRFTQRIAVAVIALAMLIASNAPLRQARIVTAQDVTPAGELRELAIDDGVVKCALGPGDSLKGKPGFGWVNKLTPASYPATLRSLSVGFERSVVGSRVKADSLYRIVVYRDPEGDGPGPDQQPDASFTGRVRGTDPIMTFNLVNPLTIQSGSFDVGALDVFGIADRPAVFDSHGKSNPPGSESFFTQNGGVSWQKLSGTLGPDSTCAPGSWLIRATVEGGAVDPLTVTKIKDPAAVEPWGVGVLTNDVIVTNLVSDNLTIINTVTNAVQNVALTDPRLCIGCGPPLGPFGVAGVRIANPVPKLYVTLFGSNTIPSKEFATSYETVLPGRVVVLQAFPNGYVQSGIISVGIGPRFPAVAANKVYVPCGGSNRVDVINSVSDFKVAEISVGPDPSSCTASLDGSKIYVTNFGDGSVSVIDTRLDRKIKDIPAPPIVFPTPAGSALPPAPATASQPWNGTVSSSNGHLYVTYWGTIGNASPNGVIAEFDTCKDEFVRVVLDDQTRGTTPGSAGSTGLPAPTAPLTKDPAMGKTLEAGGGGGGPFGVSACLPSPFGNSRDQFATFVFTNDALGYIGIMDSRIDQVVSAPPIAVAPCSKPRGVVCRTVTSLPPHFAFIACGQPENSVLMFRVPVLPENIPNIPIIVTAEVTEDIRLTGFGFADGVRFEVVRPGSSTCLTFTKSPKLKKNGRVLIQKGSLSDGTALTDAVNQNATIRVVNPDGVVRIVPR